MFKRLSINLTKFILKVDSDFQEFNDQLKMSGRVSLKDIAEKVGVSTALVSYVINGQEKEKRVGKEMVKKIQDTALELNYQPNQIARSLRRGSNFSLTCLID